MFISSEMNANIEQSERPNKLFCVSNSSSFVRELGLFDFFRQEDMIEEISSNR